MYLRFKDVDVLGMYFSQNLIDVFLHLLTYALIMIILIVGSEGKYVAVENLFYNSW